MTRSPCILLTVFVLTLSQMPVTHATEVLHWDRLPLAVPLIVGEERVLFLDHEMRIGVPPSLAGHLRVQSAGGAIYLRANAPIEPTRLQLQDASTGALILIDIAARPATPDHAPLEPVRIIVDNAHPAHPDRQDGALLESDAASAPTLPPTPIAVALTRYAAQSLYAPLRTVEPVSGLSRVNLQRTLTLDTLLPTLPVRATALGAWRLKDEWVTAIRLTNTTAQWLAPDPRALQGDFVAATLQHSDLGPAGDASDTTVLYLVTRGHGLAESLLPAASAIDAARNLSPPSVTHGTRENTHEK